MKEKRRISLTLLSFLTTILLSTSCEVQNLEPSITTNPTSLSTATTQVTTITNLIYQETMEGLTPFSTAHDWDVGSWDYALQFVKSPIYKGIKTARFEIREDQPLVAGGKRSEITIIKGPLENFTKNSWYSFAVYFPSNGYEYDDEREIINQWYQNGSPATSLRTRRDRILLESGNTKDNRKQFDIGAIAKNKWHTFVFHFIHSYGTDGLIEVWFNGTKKLTLKGGNMYDDILPKWKIGVYKSAFKYGLSGVTRRVIYFDNVKVGDDKSTYETMKPAL